MTCKTYRTKLLQPVPLKSPRSKPTLPYLPRILKRDRFMAVSSINHRNLNIPVTHNESTLYKINILGQRNRNGLALKDSLMVTPVPVHNPEY